MAKIRLALTISGALSLGAYEAGVLAALLSAIGPLCEGPDPTVRLDAIGGASAGAITGLLAARSLTAGLDPVTVMETAWVDRDDVKYLLKGYQGAPFSMTALRAMATDLFDPDKTPQVPHHQDREVRMVMVLTALRGLTLEIPGPDQVLDATTFVDLIHTTVSHDTKLDQLVTPPLASPVDVALASGANELGFPPAVLDRSGAAADYQRRGVTDFPERGHLWYSDGGTFDNEPLGHTLDLVDALDSEEPGDFERIHLLVHPHVPAAPSETAWADKSNRPTWADTAVRALRIMLTQSLADDLGRIQRTNIRLDQLDRAVATVGAAIDALPPAERDAIAVALRTALADLRPVDPGDATADPRDLLRSVAAEVAGLAEKRPVFVEVISPALVNGGSAAGADHLLSGRALSDFGGFLDVDLRRNDFRLGYRSTLVWLEDGGLTRYHLGQEDNDRALAAAHGAYDASSWDPSLTDWSATKILVRNPLTALRLALRGGRVALTSLFIRRPQV
jgi:predicted acylesterase/phospholipase RssA